MCVGTDIASDSGGEFLLRSLTEKAFAVSQSNQPLPKLDPMKTLLTTLALASTVTLTQAQGFIANMNGAQDGGGARQGTGTVNATLVGTTLSFSGSFSGLTTAATAAHIHGPGAVGINVGVIYGLGNAGIPLGATSGAISGSVNLADIGAYTVAQQISDLNNSLWYFNIHNSTFGGGEIRGQIVPVPEPGTLALVGLGGLGLFGALRRRA